MNQIGEIPRNAFDNMTNLEVLWVYLKYKKDMLILYKMYNL